MKTDGSYEMDTIMLLIDTGGTECVECHTGYLYDGASKPEHIELESIRIWLNRVTWINVRVPFFY